MMRVKPLPKTPSLPSSLEEDGGASLIRALFTTFIENNATINALVNGIQNVTWDTPVLVGAWVNFGGGYNPAGFYKDLAGFVHLRGVVKNGTETIFILPAKCRPQNRCCVASLGGGDDVCRIEIGPGGEVVWVGGWTNSFLSLDNIIFKAAE